MQPLSLRSPSGTEIIRARLLKCLQERCADFKSQGTMSAEQLAQVLGVKPKSAPALGWPGKGKALGTALSACGQTLWPRPELSWSRSDHQPSANMYLEGDNLEALKLLGLSYSGAVKVIYIDPPYNTGKDFVYRDNFAQSPAEYDQTVGAREKADLVSGELGRRMQVNKETDGRFHSNWCTLMYPRLLLARQLLRTDGVIFISIDDYEQQNLKLLCDEVFGADNLVTQLVWQRAYSPKNDAKFVSTSHDYILMYAYDRAAFAQSLRAQGLSCDFSQGQLLTYTMVGHSQEGTQELKALLQDGVFDGPKPVRLIKHLLRLAGLKAHDHELVLDFFSGSATTAQAVWKLNAEDGGNRRFIMVQLPEQSNQDQRAHANHSFATICDIGRARIRAVAAKLAAQLNLTLPPMDCTKIVRGGGALLM